MPNLQNIPPNKSFQSPKRPEIGNVGPKIVLHANHFDVKITRNIILHRYNINVQPDNVPRFVNRKILNQLMEKYKYIFGHIKFVYDGKYNLYTNNALPIGGNTNNNHCFVMEIDFIENGKSCKYHVSIQWICEILFNTLNKGFAAEVPRRDAVIAIDVILRHLPSLTYRSIGRNFFSSSTNEKQYPLGSGREIWFGYHQSVKSTDWKLLLNIDLSATAFYKSQSVIEFMCELLNINCNHMNNNFGFTLNDVQRQQFIKKIRNIKIEITDERLIKRKYRVISITKKSVTGQTFPLHIIGMDSSVETVECTVAKYYNDKYNIKLNYPNLQCLHVGKEEAHTYIPMELCKIVAGQRCLKKLNDSQTTAMIKATAKSAPEREHEINKLIQKFQCNNNEYVQEFGLKISQTMLKINGRILPTPKLQYGGGGGGGGVSLPNNNNEPSIGDNKNQTNLAYPKYGVWDMRAKRFFIGIELTDWAILSFVQQSDLPNDKLQNFIVYLRQISSDAGMKITQNPCMIKFSNSTSSSTIESKLIECKQMIKPIQLCMIILPGKSTIYADIKRIGDTVLGIVTQCIQIKNVLHTNAQTISNICLKINVKLGGVNSILLPTIRSKVFEKPIIFLGADLTHSPINNDYRRPSIAAVVGSMDAHPSRYASTIRIQPQSDISYDHRQAQAQAQFIQYDDVISDLTNMVKETLLMFYKTTSFKPHRIVMYRNANSNETFTNLLCKELVAIREACLQLESNYRPGITYIIVQKRHHTRLFCDEIKDRTYRSGNIPAGTCVDVSITNAKDFDFYLCSHQGIQGTSRPSYYNVLWDDNNFTSNELQCLTYQLCYTYARCTRSVSIPAPTYYAHLCAFRARYHLVDAERYYNPNITKDRLYKMMNDSIKIHSDIQNAMYFA